MEIGHKGCAGCAGLIFAAVVLVFVIAIANRPTPEQEAANAERVREYNAAFACQDAVRAGLKAPATAEFQAPRDARIDLLENGNYKIYSHVDAQNSFGAKLRTPYMCLVSGGAVIELKMEGR